MVLAQSRGHDPFRTYSLIDQHGPDRKSTIQGERSIGLRIAGIVGISRNLDPGIRICLQDRTQCVHCRDGFRSQIC